jgi:CBS domain-containing protein
MEDAMTLAVLLRERGPVVHVSPETTVRDVIALLAENRIGAVPVIGGDRVEGIMSERDVIRSLSRDGPGVLDWPVERVMTRPAITVDSNLPVLAGLSLMTSRRIRHLPIVESGKLVGFVSIGDLVKARIERIESEAEAMRSYIAT